MINVQNIKFNVLMLMLSEFINGSYIYENDNFGKVNNVESIVKIKSDVN